MTNASFTSALILETNNLHGGEGSCDDVERSLTRLLLHLRTQTRPLSALDELVITHSGLARPVQARLEEAAGRPLRFVALPPDADYYAAKNAGFAVTTADVVVFADSDCWPAETWLEALLRPFAADPTVQAVAGRTSYRGSLFGAAATAIDFMYFPSPLGQACTRNFYANNVAFRRQVMERAHYGRHAFYRGSCQVLGLELQAAGVKVLFAAPAHTVHRLPDSTGELLQLRLWRGADAVDLAPHLARAYLPPWARWLGSLGVVSGAAVLGARWLCSLRALRRQDLPQARGPRWIPAAMLVSALHLADAAGAVLGSLGWRRSEGARSVTALSYHRDVDGLSPSQ